MGDRNVYNDTESPIMNLCLIIKTLTPVREILKDGREEVSYDADSLFISILYTVDVKVIVKAKAL